MIVTDRIGSRRRLVGGNRLHDFLNPCGKNFLPRQVAGKFAYGKIQKQHRAQSVAQAGHGRCFIRIIQQNISRARRTGMIEIIKLQQAEVLPGRSAKQLQVFRFEIPFDDLAPAVTLVATRLSAQFDRHRARARPPFPTLQVIRVRLAIQEIDNAAAIEQKFGHRRQASSPNAPGAGQEKLFRGSKLGGGDSPEPICRGSSEPCNLSYGFNAVFRK